MVEKFEDKAIGRLRKLRLHLTRQEHLRNRRFRSFTVRTFADPEAKEQEKSAIIKMDKEIEILRSKIKRLELDLMGGV